MSEILAILAMDWPTTVMGAYWICLIVGGGLVALTLLSASESAGDVDVNVDGDLGGGFETDVDADFDADFDGDFDADSVHGGHIDTSDALEAAHAGSHLLTLSAWISVRFFVYFAAVFGAVGIVFTYLSDVAFNTTLSIALVAGAAFGQGVHHLMRAIKRSSGNTMTRPRDYLYRPGRVIVGIVTPNKGEVAVEVRATERFLPAVAVGGTANLAVGAEVMVVGYRGGIVQVVAREEYERQRRGAGA